MNIEQLKEHLKQNLEIRLSSIDGTYYGPPFIKAEIWLDGELIDESECESPQQHYSGGHD